MRNPEGAGESSANFLGAAPRTPEPSQTEAFGGPVQAVTPDRAGRLERARQINRRHLARLLVAYLACRGVTLAVIALWSSPVPFARRVEAFDGGYYAHIVGLGYPTAVPPTGGSPIGFFPGYPLIVRGFDEVTRAPAWAGLLAVSLVTGAVATTLVALVAKQSTDGTTGWATGLWWQLLPLSFLLCIGYSEGAFVAAAAGSLLAMLRRRWWLAGLGAAVAGFIRPTGLVLVLVGLVLLIASYRRERSLAPWPVVLLAPLGALGYFVYIKVHEGSFGAWFTAERRGWHVHEDFGEGTLKFFGRSVLSPTLHPWWDIVSLTMVGVAILLVAALRMRLPLPLLVFTIGILFVAVTSSVGTLSSFPRVAFTAFPLAIPLARGLQKLPVPARVVLGAVSLGLACVLGVVVTTTRLVTP